uniref:Uncharacterized protein n=1 Tax=Anguilla anguilla TaxID=7936 RepID=A0A0E9U9Y3_ANGAN
MPQNINRSAIIKQKGSNLGKIIP